MNNEEKLNVLNVVAKGGSVRKLIHEGLSFKQISLLLEALVNDELLIYEDEKIKLTKKGSEFLENGFELIKKTNKNQWIKPEEKSKIAKLGEDFIFVPLQSELDF